MGGTFNGRTVSGIGIEKVEQIWYRALTTYYTDSETFNDAYLGLRQACADLYSASDLAELTKALPAVEMDQTRTGDPPHPVTPPLDFTSMITGPGPSGTTVTLTWNSRPRNTNTSYQVLTSTNLTTWQTVAVSILSQGTSTTYTYTVPASASRRLFFRVDEE